MQAEPNPFSPNRDGVKDEAGILALVQVSQEAIQVDKRGGDDDDDDPGESGGKTSTRFVVVGVAQIGDPFGLPVRLIDDSSEVQARVHRGRRNDRGQLSVSLAMLWNGLNESGQAVPDAVYSYKPFAALSREKQGGVALSPVQRTALDHLRDALIVSPGTPHSKLKIKVRGGPRPEVRIGGAAHLSAEQQSLVETLKRTLAGSSKDLRVEVKLIDVVSTEPGSVTLDVTPPRMVAAPAPGSIQTDSALSVELDFEEPVSGVDPETLSVDLNGEDISDRFVATRGGATSSLVPLTSGRNVLQASVQDLGGNLVETESVFDGPPGLPPPPAQCTGLPDLQILRFDQRPLNPRPGQRVEVFAQIRNKGFAPACDFRVKFEVAAEGFFKDYVELGTKMYTGCLAPGQSALVSRQSIPTLPTLIHYRVTVDSLDQVAECDETNNVKADCFSMLTRIFVPTPRKRIHPIPVRNRRPGTRTVVRVGTRTTPQFGAEAEPGDLIFEPGGPSEGGVVIGIQPGSGFVPPFPGRPVPPVIGTTPIEIRTAAPRQPLERIVVQPVPIEIVPSPPPDVFTYSPPIPPELLPPIEEIVTIIQRGGNPRPRIEALNPYLPQPPFQPVPPGGGGGVVTAPAGSPPPSPPPPFVHPRTVIGDIESQPLPLPADYQRIITDRLPVLVREIGKRYHGQVPPPIDRIVEDIINCINLVNDAILANSEGDLAAGLAFLDESVSLLRGLVDFIGESLSAGLIDQETSDRWTNTIQGIVQLVLDLEEMKKEQDQAGMDFLEEGVDELITLVDGAPDAAFAPGGRTGLRGKITVLRRRIEAGNLPGFQREIIRDLLPALDRLVTDPGLRNQLEAQLNGLLADSGEGGLVSIEVQLVDPLSSVVLRPGEDIRFAAFCNFAFGDSTDCTSRVQWQSENTTVAASLGGGVFHASSFGTVSIHASLSDVISNSFEFYVVASTPFITGVHISGADPAVTLTVGGSLSLEAGCSLSDASSADCTGRVDWVTTDPAVAQVAVANGTATLQALTPGVALVSGSVEGATSDFVQVTVTSSPISGVAGFTFPGFLDFDVATGGYVSSLTPLSLSGVPYVLGPPIVPGPATVFLIPSLGGEPGFVFADNTPVPGVDGVTNFSAALLSIPFGDTIANGTLYVPLDLNGFQRFVYFNLPAGTVVDAFIENILSADERGFGFDYFWNLGSANVIIAPPPPPPPTIVAVQIFAPPTGFSLQVGQQIQLGVACTNSLGQTFPCADQVTFSSTNPSVATVQQGTAVLTALSPGTTFVTASADSVTSLPVPVSVVSPDTAPPETTISACPPFLTNQTSASFAFSSTEIGSSFRCALDSGGFVACFSPQNFFGLSDGSHVFRVRAVDSAGNIDPTPATCTWTVDTVPPETSIAACPASVTNQTSATFDFASTEPDSGFGCEWDGLGYSGCTTPQTFSSLSDGSHAFRVQAVDAAGNVDTTPATCTWTVDTVPPETSILDCPTSSTDQPSQSFNFLSTELGSSFECELDGSGFYLCFSPQTFISLSIGTHLFSVRAMDPGGNTDHTPATCAWSVNGCTGRTRLTFDPASDGSASISNDGAKIAFVSTRQGSQDIFLMDFDGSNQVALAATPLSEFAPAISGDGRRVAFLGQVGTEVHVFAIDSNGANLVQITPNGSGSHWDPPSIAGDGSRIVYSSSRMGMWQVFLFREGAGETQLTSQLADARRPVISDDGRFVAFDSGGDVYVVSSSGGSPTQLTDRGGLGFPEVDLVSDISGDGLLIAFTRNGANVGGGYVVKADGTGLTHISGNDTGFHIRLSLDGSNAIFACGAGDRLCVARTDGSLLLVSTEFHDADPDISGDALGVVFTHWDDPPAGPSDSDIYRLTCLFK
ncbi:MAG: PD40 domain-containing protein [Nitrospirae bacterium]|nr:PD40 domain-containing protein [Nitrospirota bacterium]